MMKSRLAITSIVALGMALGAPGLSLAATPNAAGSQYGKPTGGVGQPTQVQPSDQTLLPSSAAAPVVAPVTSPQVDVAEAQQEELPTDASRPAAERPRPEADVQAAKQTVGAAEGSPRLPFTGLAAMPLLFAGLALLGGGMAFRKASRQG